MSEVPLYDTVVVRSADPSFRALSGRPTFTVRRHKVNEDSLSEAQRNASVSATTPPARVRVVRAGRDYGELWKWHYV